MPDTTTPPDDAKRMAREIAAQFQHGEQATQEMAEVISAALVARYRAGMEMACQCVCMACFSGIPVVHSFRGLAHEMSWGMQRCDAAAIRAKMEKLNER